MNGQIYDKFGKRYLISDIKVFTEVSETEVLINSYKSTVYEHELSLIINELVNKGYWKQKKGIKYNPEKTIISIKNIKTELIKRLGTKEFKKIDDSIDLSFVKNKPII